MFCTENERKTCNVEKMGCEGCYYNDNIKNLEEILELCSIELEENNENLTAILDLTDLKSLKKLIEEYKLLKEIEKYHKIENGELRKENSDWKKLCDECSNVAKSDGFTKEDINKIIKETREMQWKAKKYDELIEKLEKDKMEQFDDYVIYLIESYLEIVKGAENERL